MHCSGTKKLLVTICHVAKIRKCIFIYRINRFKLKPIVHAEFPTQVKLEAVLMTVLCVVLSWFNLAASN